MDSSADNVGGKKRLNSNLNSLVLISKNSHLRLYLIPSFQQVDTDCGDVRVVVAGAVTWHGVTLCFPKARNNSYAFPKLEYSFSKRVKIDSTRSF